MPHRICQYPTQHTRWVRPWSAADAATARGRIIPEASAVPRQTSRFEDFTCKDACAGPLLLSGLVWQPLFPPGSRCFPCVANPCAKFSRTIAPSCLETGPTGILAHSEPNLRVETRPTFRRRAAIPESRIVSSSRLLCHGRTRRHHSVSRRAPLRQ